MKIRMRVLAASLLIALSPMASADDAGSLGTQVSTNHGQQSVASKIASEFTSLAGSKDNALALVNGLRNGTDITLTTPVAPTGPGTGTGTGTTGTGTTGTGTTGTGTGTGTTGTGTGTTTTTIDPPTGKMGWGEVKIALALAEDSLAKAGITNPTPEQLQAALNGGDITVKNADGTTTTTTLKGVLTMRASGMGWGQIAKADGTTVGAALRSARNEARVAHVDDDASKSRLAGKTLSTTGTKSASVAPKAVPRVGGQGITTAAGTGTAAPKSGKGITTAAGNSAGASHGSKGITTASGMVPASGSHGITTASGAAAGGNVHALGRGVVTAAGGGVTNVASAGPGSHGASSAGLVSGTGAATGAAVTTAQGSGNGHGGEHGRGGKTGG
ncbi:MAG TPA: hypothetical protein VFE23_19590 [Usitatibacter sp.]|nr:hypothetical protein [Usitatibacter sp.]